MVISAIVITLVACSAASNSTTNSTLADSSHPTSSENSPSPPTIATKASAIPGVDDIKEITFNPNTKGVAVGFFDSGSGVTELKQEVSKPQPLRIEGWAILPDQDRIADQVIITAGEQNSWVAVVLFLKALAGNL